MAQNDRNKLQLHCCLYYYFSFSLFLFFTVYIFLFYFCHYVLPLTVNNEALYFNRAGSRGEGTSRCDVTVHVTDSNDNRPRWTTQPMPTAVDLLLMDGTATAADRPISPSQLAFAGVISLTATDADEGNNGTIFYWLHTGF